MSEKNVNLVRPTIKVLKLNVKFGQQEQDICEVALESLKSYKFPKWTEMM